MKIILESEKFNALMINHGFSKSKLAQLTGLSAGHVFLVLNGKQNITPRTARKIADALDVKPEEIFDYCTD